MKLRWTLPLAFLRSQEGSFLIEYALFAPILCAMLAISFDVGMAVYDSMALKDGARAGAQYAMKYPNDATGLTQVVSDATAVNPTNLTVTSSLSCQCANGATVGCGTTCSDGSATETYITVAVAEAYQTLLPYPQSVAPLFNLSGTAMLRIR